MAKKLTSTIAGPDDPIFSGRFIISSPKSMPVKKPAKNTEEPPRPPIEVNGEEKI